MDLDLDGDQSSTYLEENPPFTEKARGQNPLFYPVSTQKPFDKDYRGVVTIQKKIAMTV